jgi:UDP-N-acetylmuramyl tripeptide synthase
MVAVLRDTNGKTTTTTLINLMLNESSTQHLARLLQGTLVFQQPRSHKKLNPVKRW